MTLHKEEGMLRIKVRVMFPTETCVQFSCKLPKRRENLTRFSPSLKCNKIESVGCAWAHTMLPLGWFLLCGKRAYTYVPANVTGGPCSLG